MSVKIGDRVYLRGASDDVREVREFRNNEVGHVDNIDQATYVLVPSADGKGLCGWGLEAIVRLPTYIVERTYPDGRVFKNELGTPKAVGGMVAMALKGEPNVRISISIEDEK